MLTFFHGWRRKMGAATLVMACVFAGGWVRSHSFIDIANFPNGRPVSVVLRSGEGELVIAIVHEEIIGMKMLSMWMSAPADDIAGFGRLMQHWTSRSGIEEWATIKLCWVLPYWSIIFPLSLLSAYLLLSKPQSCVSSSEAGSGK